MKKTKILSVVLLCGLSLIGCSDNDENVTTPTNQTQITTTNDTETESTPEEASTAKSDTTAATYNEELLDLNSYDVINDSSDEARTHYIGFDLAVSDNGYYISETQWITFMDKASGKYVPWCNRPDCTHEGEDCNAYFNGLSQGDLSYNLSYLQFYDGSLYTMGQKTDGSVSLCKISEDGSVRENYMNLCKVEPTAVGGEGTHYRTPEICIHRGYVYYIMPLEATPTLRRMKLGTEEVEELFKLPEGGAMMYRMRPYGDFVFFQGGDFTEEGISGMTSGIYAYNVENGELKLVKDGAISTYDVSGSTLYYTNSEGVSAYDLASGKDSLFIKNSNNPVFSVDDRYLYVENEDLSSEKNNLIVEVYDMSGKLVNEIQADKSIGHRIGQIHYGDGIYLFAEGMVDENTLHPKGARFYAKVDDIEAGDGYLYWQPME